MNIVFHQQVKCGAQSRIISGRSHALIYNSMTNTGTSSEIKEAGTHSHGVISFLTTMEFISEKKKSMVYVKLRAVAIQLSGVAGHFSRTKRLHRAV